MSRRTVALVGLSGVGKSTLLKKAGERVSFLHLQASQLIKDELERKSSVTRTSEELRTDVVIENQTLLITAFRREAAMHDGLIVLDGHVLVDTQNGLIEIPAAVFDELGVEHFIVLQEHSSHIHNQRLRDGTRARPQRTEVELADHQRWSFVATANIALELGCPVSLLTSQHEDELLRILTSETERIV